MKLAGGIAAGLVVGIFSVAVLAQPIYVANPGESFGPIKMGEFAPIAPRIICITADPSNSQNKLVLIYYLESGLQILTVASDGSPYRVGDIRASSSPFRPFKDGCQTNEGRIVTPSIKVPVPKAVYVTNKGVQLGATVEGVLKKHGAPVCVAAADQIFHLKYEGLTFSFSAGRVDMIEVNDRDEAKYFLQHGACI